MSAGKMTLDANKLVKCGELEVRTLLRHSYGKAESGTTGCLAVAGGVSGLEYKQPAQLVGEVAAGSVGGQKLM